MSKPTGYTLGRSASVEGNNVVFQPVARRRLFASPSPVKKRRTSRSTGKGTKGGTPMSRGGTPMSRGGTPTSRSKGTKGKTPTVAEVAQKAANDINRGGTIVPNHLVVGSPQTPRRQGIPMPTPDNLSKKLREDREAGVRMYRNVLSKIKKIENSPPKAKRELFPNNKKIEKQVRLERKLELKNYMTKADFNKLVEKLDKPRTPAAQKLTKSNIAELLKPLINKKKNGSKYSLFGSFYPKNKKDGKPLFSRKPESVVRDIAKSASKKFRKEIVTKVKAPRTPAMPVMRTPTTGQRKKHVIELIDRVIKKMKISRDTEKKIIDFYEALSEKYIKQMFGGKSKEEVRSIIKKQVDFFSKKKKT